MTKIIGVLQQKGGTGRTTLCTNLAGELAKIGPTLLIDCDHPQGTSESWFLVRQGIERAQNLHLAPVSSHQELVKKVEASQAYDFVVIDGPPRAAEITRASLILADLCLVTIGASGADIWSTADLVKLITEAKQVKRINARLVWSRHRGHIDLTQELVEAAEQQLGIKPLNIALNLRTAYVEALLEGKTAAEVRDPAARAEVNNLVAEVLAALRKKA